MCKNFDMGIYLHLGVRLFFKLKDRNITRTERLKTKNIPIIIPTMAAVITSSSSPSASKNKMKYNKKKIREISFIEFNF